MSNTMERQSDSFENIDIESLPSTSRNSIFSQRSSSESSFLKKLILHYFCCFCFIKKTTLESELLNN